MLTLLEIVLAIFNKLVEEVERYWKRYVVGEELVAMSVGGGFGDTLRPKQIFYIVRCHELLNSFNIKLYSYQATD